MQGDGSLLLRLLRYAARSPGVEAVGRIAMNNQVCGAQFFPPVPLSDEERDGVVPHGEVRDPPTPGDVFGSGVLSFGVAVAVSADVAGSGTVDVGPTSDRCVRVANIARRHAHTHTLTHAHTHTRLNTHASARNDFIQCAAVVCQHDDPCNGRVRAGGLWRSLARRQAAASRVRRPSDSV
jgi:hypothetical protein